MFLLWIGHGFVSAYAPMSHYVDSTCLKRTSDGMHDEVFLEGRKFQISGGGWEGEISQGVVKFSFSEGSVPVDEIF